MKIRPAVQEDVREMMEIFNYEVRNSTASFAITEQSYEERLAWFRSHGGERHPLIAAEQDGRVAGYACLSDYRPYEAYKGTAELSVYVSRDFRRPCATLQSEPLSRGGRGASCVQPREYGITVKRWEIWVSQMISGRIPRGEIG